MTPASTAPCRPLPVGRGHQEDNPSDLEYPPSPSRPACLGCPTAQRQLLLVLPRTGARNPDPTVTSAHHLSRPFYNLPVAGRLLFFGPESLHKSLEQKAMLHLTSARFLILEGWRCGDSEYYTMGHGGMERLQSVCIEKLLWKGPSG